MTNKLTALTVKLCLTLLTLPLLLLASPQKSLEAAKNFAFTEEEGSPIPYVTDGLVAMWDAEWNAGFGVHDPETSVWVDLAGGHDAEVQSGFFSDDGFSGLAYAPNPQLSSCTVEVVLSFSKSGSFYAFDSRNSSDYSGFGIWQLWDSQQNPRMRWVIGREVGWWQPSFLSTPIGERMTYSFKADDSGYKNVYLNGERLQGSGTRTGFSYGTSPEIKIGHSNAVIYSIRIYNRPLSDSEIAINYSIDRLRFNLP